MTNIIGRGAEADLILKDFDEVLYPNKNFSKVLVKHRKSKKYRIAELDEKLREYRTLHEAKLLSEAKKAGVATPIIFRIDRLEMKIVMEYVTGDLVKDFLEQIGSEKRKNLCRDIGERIGMLHNQGIIHGDLTTSNMIKSDSGEIYFIDFGLGELNSSTESRGTDLHLLHRTLESTHFEVSEEAYENILKGYEDSLGQEAEAVIQRVKEIERRGRYVEKEER